MYIWYGVVALVGGLLWGLSTVCLGTELEENAKKSRMLVLVLFGVFTLFMVIGIFRG